MENVRTEMPDFVKPPYRMVVDVVASAACLVAYLPVAFYFGWLLKALATVVVLGALGGIFKRPNGGSLQKDVLSAAAYVGLTWLAMAILGAVVVAVAAEM
jgi:hypothetical protein